LFYEKKSLAAHFCELTVGVLLVVFKMVVLGDGLAVKVSCGRTSTADIMGTILGG
jgi:hypothetical protein